MHYQLRFTPEAEETYDALVEQLRNRWGNSFVIKFERKVLKSLTLIETSPYIYPVVEEITAIRKCVLHKNCSMLYKIYPDVVLIVCFWDNRQDPILI